MGCTLPGIGHLVYRNQASYLQLGLQRVVFLHPVHYHNAPSKGTKLCENGEGPVRALDVRENIGLSMEDSRNRVCFAHFDEHL